MEDVLTDSDLLMAAADAARGAYAPHSHFAVGAAVLLFDGTIVTGSNQECDSYSLTLCAERVALAAAFSAHPLGRVRRIAIYALSAEGGAVTPCGACREYIAQCARRSRHDIEVLTTTCTPTITTCTPTITTCTPTITTCTTTPSTTTCTIIPTSTITCTPISALLPAPFIL